jgi:predicted metalloenzyme YecM
MTCRATAISYPRSKQSRDPVYPRPSLYRGRCSAVAGRTGDLPSRHTRDLPYRGCSAPRDRRCRTESVKRETRRLWNPTLAMQGWGALVLLSGESGFTAGFAIQAHAFRAISGCSALRDRRCRTESVKRETRRLWNPTLATQRWGTLVLLSGESGFTAGFAIQAHALRAIRGCSALRDRRCRTESVKRETRRLWNPTLATQRWGTLVLLSGESGFTAKP